ncbi:polysaccharide biosynthesis protein [Thalassobacillus sp. CUG 92003]|uniref:putative polysaccharide biosynthesis protein n=1 Tax=Thalassobacillus sp. CUG 92003 TaxID=2736641 RepID=UPI0015E6EB2A|nr:polysaccharide biosynthesis protein [Thalassobacillus sp. CUG 92003]
MSKFVKGTMLLTGATFLSKFLGMIYLIPFQELVGERGGALYLYAYNPYNILISISTLGVPLAVSKFVSKYNALGDYETGRKMLKYGMQLMALTGLIAFLTLFFGAEQVAKWSITEGNDDAALGNVTNVIQMVSFALLIIPSMSIVRGFFQGYESMAPTALSQVLEQIVRIIFLLVAVYIVLNVFGGSISTAVGFATFAAFIGAIASCIVLFGYWKKRKPYLDRQVNQQEFVYDLTKKDMFKELLGYAGPFVLVGIATPLYQMVDQFTFNDAMFASGFTRMVSEGAYSALFLYGHKLVIIPVTLAIGLSLALLPAITSSFTENKQTQLFQQINQALQIVMLLILPSVAGLALLSNEAYASFYGLQHIELYGSLLAWYAPVGLGFALFTVSSSILQGINKQNFAVISLAMGLLVKAGLNIPFIMILDAKGAAIATGLAVATAVGLNVWKIKSSLEFAMKQLVKRSLLIVIFTVMMLLVVALAKWLLETSLNPQESRFASVIVLISGVGIGGTFYLWLAYQSTLLERVIGGRVKVLDRFLKGSGKG